MLALIAALIPDDLVVLIAILVGFGILLLTCYALLYVLMDIVAECDEHTDRLETAMREREALRKALGRG